MPLGFGDFMSWALVFFVIGFQGPGELILNAMILPRMEQGLCQVFVHQGSWQHSSQEPKGGNTQMSTDGQKNTRIVANA